MEKENKENICVVEFLNLLGLLVLTDGDSSARQYTKHQTVFGIVANSKNLIGMRTYTYRRSAFINIADRWNVYLCSWLLELIFAINKGN